MLIFYGRFIQRQWRLSAIRLLCGAIAIACAAAFSITLLGNRLERLFDNQSKEVLAADLVLQSTKRLTSQQTEIIDRSALSKAQILLFPTMANGNEKFLLSSVKAVSDAYPLRGKLQVSDSLFGEPIAISHGPSPGEVWVEDRVLHELGLSPGGTVNIGERSLKIARILVFEPDRGASFYSFTPRIMMHWNDVDSTGVVEPGSRVKFRYLFSGEAGAVAGLQQRFLPTLQLNQKFITVDEANETLASVLERAFRFLYLTALIAVLLGAVSVALASYQYAAEMTHQYALLRCLGLRGRRLYGAILVPFFVFTLAATGVGLLLGGGIHWLMLQGLGDELIRDSLPAPSMKPFWISGVTVLLIVSSFAWPFLKRLLDTPPRILLSQSGSAQPIFFSGMAMPVGLAALVFVGTGEILISFYIIALLGLLIMLAYLLIQAVISRIIAYSKTRATTLRLAARMLGANRRMTGLQIIAIAVTFFALALIQTLRDDLITSWQSKVPDDAPNFFAINLFDADTSDFIQLLERERIPHSPLYPVVRGRLSAVNDVPIREYVGKGSGRDHESLNRDLALTWSRDLPAENKIIEGKWQDTAGGVSVEQGVAEKLKLKLGDRLEFTADARKIDATVSSIRTVEWESFTPNFYMIFYPGALDGLPITHIASMYMDPSRRSLLPSFVQQFPTAAFFDVDYLLSRIRGIIERVSAAVEIMLYAALGAGLAVFASIEMVLRRHRSYSTAIYKSLGAATGLIWKIYCLQFILIGLIAGAIAYGLNTAIGMVISIWFIESDYIFNIKTAALCLLITPTLVLIAGYISILQSGRTSARNLLTEM